MYRSDNAKGGKKSLMVSVGSFLVWRHAASRCDALRSLRNIASTRERRLQLGYVQQGTHRAHSHRRASGNASDRRASYRLGMRSIGADEGKNERQSEFVVIAREPIRARAPMS